MKRGTPNHPKTHHLAATLHVDLWGAVGVLESVWHFGQAYAQPGDIGRHSNEAIARAIGWNGDAAVLISGLTAAGWLDRCRCHRLRIHDWPEHCDQTVERYVKERSGFIPCYDDPSSVLAPDEPAVAVPSLAVPSLAIAIGAKRRSGSKAFGAKSPTNDTPEARAIIDAYNENFGTRVGPTPGNLRASGRALEAGYTIEQIRSVFAAVRERKTPTAVWCAENNREFEYLIRPAYKHNRTQELIQGPLDKIPNELATGRRSA